MDQPAHFPFAFAVNDSYLENAEPAALPQIFRHQIFHFPGPEGVQVKNPVDGYFAALFEHISNPGDGGDGQDGITDKPKEDIEAGRAAPCRPAKAESCKHQGSGKNDPGQ